MLATSLSECLIKKNLVGNAVVVDSGWGSSVWLWALQLGDASYE